MTGTNVVDPTLVAQWIGYLISLWGIGFASGVLYRTVLKVIEVAGRG